jgi:WD40 repeat protein
MNCPICRGEVVEVSGRCMACGAEWDVRERSRVWLGNVRLGARRWTGRRTMSYTLLVRAVGVVALGAVAAVVGAVLVAGGAWPGVGPADRRGLAGHKNLAALAFSVDGGFIATAGVEVVYDGTERVDRPSIRLWRASDGTSRSFETDRLVTELAFSPDGLLLAGCDNETFSLWRVGDGRLVERIRPEDEEPDRQQPAQVAFDPEGSLWLTTWQDTKSIDHANRKFSKTHVMPIKNEQIVAGRSTVFDSWSISTPSGARCVLTEAASHGQPGPLRLVYFENADRTGSGERRDAGLAIGFLYEIKPDRTSLVHWNVEKLHIVGLVEGRELATISDDLGKEPARLAVSAGGRMVAGAVVDGVRVWWADGTPRSRLLRTRATVSHLAFSPDGRNLVIGSGGSVEIWRLVGPDPE